MKSAQEIIGEQAPGDFNLQPETHAEALPPEAGALARILRSEPVRALVAEYRAADSDAIRLQKRYRSLSRFALILQTAAVFVGAAFIIGVPENTDWIVRALELNTVRSAPMVAPNAFTLVELLCVVIAAGVATFIESANLFDRWNRSRAKAEVARVGFFALVTKSREETKSGESALLPLQLEYFRRYQLDTERNYYGRRGKEESASALRYNRALTLIGLALFLLSCFSAYRLYEAHENPALAIDLASNRIIAFLGALAAATSAALNNWSLIAQYKRNAIRYTTTAKNLETLVDEYLDSARAAAAKNDVDGVLSFVAAVNHQISVEHQEWLLLQDHQDRPDLGGIGVQRFPKLPSKTASAAGKKPQVLGG